MANPFLMTDDETTSTTNDMNSNPFLMQDTDENVAEIFNDNPFLVQASNPFATGFGHDDTDETTGGGTNDYYSTDNIAITNTARMFRSTEPAEPITITTAEHYNPIDSAMSFFGTTITEDDIEDATDPKSIALNTQQTNNNHNNNIITDINNTNNNNNYTNNNIDINNYNNNNINNNNNNNNNHNTTNNNNNIINNETSLFDDAAAYSSEDELNKLKSKGPPPRPVPPSQTTQDLISSVADQLDQTSSHLLGRLPATRTPSPVSMRDLHSPSPTHEFGDLLDVSDVVPSASSRDIMNYTDTDFSNDFMSDNNHIISHDNPFADISVSEPVKIEPVRPPPPRPTPPRPSAPQRPCPPQQSTIQNIGHPKASETHHSAVPPPRPAPIQQDADLFDMFGSNDIVPKKPPPPKSKEDILSLFAAPANTTEQKPDLLSGDILLMDNEESSGGIPVMSETMTHQQSPKAETIINEHVQQTIVSDSIMDANNTQINEIPAHTDAQSVELIESIDNATNVSSVSPVVVPETVSIPEVLATHYEKPELERENILDEIDKFECLSEHSVTESIVTATAIPASTSGSILNMNITSEHSDTASQPDHMMDATLDFNVVTPATSANPFASPETEEGMPTMNDVVTVTANVAAAAEDVNVVSTFGMPKPTVTTNIFAADDESTVTNVTPRADEFDAFSAKFDSVKKDDSSLLLDGFGTTNTIPTSTSSGGDAWGSGSDTFDGGINSNTGFDNDEGFDSFLTMSAPARTDSHDSTDDIKEFSVVIRPKDNDTGLGLPAPILAPPPPKSPQNSSLYSGDSSPRVNPFDKGDDAMASTSFSDIPTQMKRTDSQETPPTPLFDEDVSQPLEDFPRTMYQGDGWEIQLRQPNKKKITGQRFWKKIWMKFVLQGDNPVLQLYNTAKDKDPFQELPLQGCYSVSEIGAQQFDQFGKIFTVKLQYIFYKERPGVRPGQVTKAERLTNKLSQFAAYAIQGDYQGVKEFGSDLKKLGLPVEHAPQVSQLFKIGSHSYEDLKQFSVCVEEYLFKLNVHRDRALNYKMEEVQLTAVDELYVEQDAEGHILKQIARVRLHFLGFLSGMPTIELGVNDLWRQGKEVVGRHDIIPVVTEEWIRLEGVEFHACVQQNEYERSRTIRFQPPDAGYIELMRFRVRPPKNRELPLQLKATWCVTGNKVELRADALVPGFASRKLGQIPCEDVSIRFPIPECWIYLFRVEKHFRYGSVKSAHRRTGKIKGIERILGTVDQLQESLIEVTSGQAKYEHHHRAIVWRCPRLPKEGQGAYTTHQLVVRMALTSYDQIPEQLAPYCFVEFTMPATQVSHVTVRSVSVQDSDSDDPPEKYVRYLARHEYRVGIEHTQGESTNPYLAATTTTKQPIKEEPAKQPAALPIIGSDSDSDSN